MKHIIIEINFLLFIYIFFFESFSECQTSDSCLPNFRAYNSPNDNNYEKCLSSVDECIHEQYNYYNSYELKCWKTGCPSTYYSNENGVNNLPSRDISNNNCVQQCGQSFPKHNYGEKVCKKDCGDKFYTIDDPNTCIGGCNTSYPYISESNEKLCLKECQSDKFIIEENNKKICISSCKDYKNYYFRAGDQKCYGSCPSGYNFKDNYNLECLKNCLDNSEPTRIFTKGSICVNGANPNNEYYYESDKIILSSCPRFYQWNSNICRYNCPGNVEKSGTNYYCNCSNNNKKIRINDTITIGSTSFTVNLCIDNCLSTEFLINGGNQCITECPKNYIAFDYICYIADCKNGQIFDETSTERKCIDKGTNRYYKKTIGQNNVEINVKVNDCSGTKKYIKDENDQECVSTCPQGNNYYDQTTATQNIMCKKNCGNNFYISKTGNLFECVTTCPSYTFYQIVNGEEVAIKLCSDSEKLTAFNCILDVQKDNPANNKTRYSSCPSRYKFNKTEGSYKVCYPDNPCSGVDSYYFDGNCLSGQQCKNKNRLYIVGKECVDTCTQKKTPKYNIYECSTNCGLGYNYIDSGDYCVQKCPQGRNYISSDGQYCKSQCESSENYYEESNSGYKIYKCINAECQNNNANRNYKLSGYNTHECFKECPSNLKYLSGNKCYDNCLFDSANSFTWESDNKCSNTCKNPNYYYYDKEKICKSACNNEDYAFKESNTQYQCIKDCSIKNKKSFLKKINNQINMCVDSCDESKPYINDGFCIDKCPDTKKFFIKKTVMQDLECLIDCPVDSPYYTKDENDNILGCENSCNDYIIENYTDTKLNAKLCISKCDGSIAKYSDYKYIIEKDEKKYCYAICPYQTPFHKVGNGVKCLSDCSEAGNDLLYHEINDIICKNELNCANSYIDFNTKLCLSQDQNQCPSNRNYTTKINTNKYMCTDECEYKGYTLSTPYNTCVENCEDINNKFQRDIEKKNSFGVDCFCANLYYIHDLIKVECFEINEQICKEVSEKYRIRMYGTNECVQTCNGSKVLSLLEDTCYDELYNCTEDSDKYTKLITKNNGQKKCDCQFRFYYITDDVSKDKRRVKKCMNETARCHDEGKSKYVPETLECVDDCPDEFKFLFQNYFCLRNCPKDSVLKANNVCECVPPKKFWHKITSRTFECLDTCHDTYPVYAPSNNRCLSSCKHSYFPIFHQNKCYRTCNNSPMLNIVNATNITESKELYDTICKCEQETTWYRNESKTIICSGGLKDCKSFPDHYPFKYLVYKTWECVDECPEDNPYFFNNYCFEKCSSAPSYLNIVYEGLFECQCSNLWYNETSNNSKICIDPDKTECFLYEDKNLKYKINSTNECVEKCPDEMYVFNYVCYDKCPENTVDNTKDKTCSCNTNTGYYYEYKRGDVNFDNQFFECAVDECPENIKDKSKIDETRKYLLKEESKCLKSCKEDNKFSYYHICVYPCPNLTKLENNEICSFYDLTDPNLKNRTALKNATNVQAFYLYNESLASNKNEFFFEKYNVSILIYGLDLDNSYKDIFFGSEKYKDLTYIDFSTCLNKLYLDKNISADEKIIIAKYDIRNGSYLINQVEYELFSNKTNERLDALVCSPYELIISYPLNLSKYDYIDEGVVENDIQKKFDYGKELYNQDNNINTFDFNSSIYKNFCRGVEINGKDLVFEDRYSELYPNKMLLCENNCTINNTDFELERINCKCTYKGYFDYDREEDIDDIFNNPNYYIPTQSPANAEVIKCISNFTIKQTIVHNTAFYYCTIVIAIELALAFISSAMGINTITNFMKPILNKIQNQDFGKKPKEKKGKSIGFKEQNIISTTNRPLNNPPKRNNDIGDDDQAKNEDNLFDKNDLDSNSNSNNNDKPSDYEINIKKGNKDDNNNPSYNNKFKAEFIPSEYNTKFFKQSDKGVIKKIDRSKLPFKISPDTQYLVEKRKDIEYDNDYLDGTFYPSQNILIITDGPNNNIEKIVKYIKYEKMSKNEKLNQKFQEKNKLFEKLNTNYSQYKEKDLITVKKIKPNFSNFYDDREISDEFDEDSDDMKIDEENAGLFTLIKREQLFLRLQYKKYLEKKHPNNLSIFIAEILDKIYIVKIILFLRKYDIFTHQLSLYVFCHLLLLSLLCGFFTIRVIKKIWRESNYPGIGFYLLYGLISNIIIWIIYQIFLYILDFRDKIKEIVSLQKELKEQEMYEFDDNIDERNEKIFKKKYTLTIKRIKCIIFAFYITMFIIIVFCTIYLISFFALYTGTRKRVFKAYYLSLIIILIIKFVYGFSLASLRIASKINKMKTLYKVVYILDKYIS